jgi:hypothetical protein
MDDRSATHAYEAPGIESRQDVSLPLIGTVGSPPPSPSAVFRGGIDYEPPRVEERTSIDEPLVGLANSGLTG